MWQKLGPCTHATHVEFHAKDAKGSHWLQLQALLAAINVDLQCTMKQVEGCTSNQDSNNGSVTATKICQRPSCFSPLNPQTSWWHDKTNRWMLHEKQHKTSNEGLAAQQGEMAPYIRLHFPVSPMELAAPILIGRCCVLRPFYQQPLPSTDGAATPDTHWERILAGRKGCVWSDHHACGN
eukprot:TRINITY_DN66759_c0_g3_i2.p1 TRINITY_DN66759_c0_g3~~TRINITY_DN66759_c0_g3_i2.p1  ORF type:complete len:180 (+),score=9.48 TRINITY_DN66759_c0_g3_i2:490-1029(+)